MLPQDDQTRTPRAYPLLHCLVLLPGLGLLVVFLARLRTQVTAEREELKEALVNQSVAAAIWVVHAVLQLGIEGVGWLWDYTAEMGVAHGASWVPSLLSISSSLNVGAGIVEWGFLVFAGLRAATGRPYMGWGNSTPENTG